jgi:uncharacterized protein (DUF58 family)
VTALGRVFIGVAVIGLAGGYWLNWIELVSVGYASLIAVCISLMFLISGRQARVVLVVPELVTVAGSMPTVIVRIENPGRLRQGPLAVELLVDGVVQHIHVPSLKAGSVRDFDRGIQAESRGVLLVGPARAVRRDPLGLFRRSTGVSAQFEIVVHPRIASIPAQSTGLIRDLEGSPTRDLTASDVSFHALREYVPGDDRRYIHWKSTAKTGTHMVRQFEETRRSHIMIVLPLSGADFVSADEFELAVSVAGSLGVRAIRDARTVSVITGPGAARRTVQGPWRTLSRPAQPGHRLSSTVALAIRTPTALLNDLSRINVSESPSQLQSVARGAADLVQGVSVAFLLCGSGVTARVLRAAANQFPLGVEAIAIVCDPGSAPGLTRMADLRLLRISRLEELPSALVRAASAA